MEKIVHPSGSHKMLRVLGFVVLLSWSNTVAGVSRIDSMLSIAESTAHDTIRGQTYLNLGMEVYLQDADRAHEFWQKALDLAEKNLQQNNPFQKAYLLIKADALGSLGYLDQGNAHDSLAIERYKEAGSIMRAVGDRNGQAQILNNVALIYLNRGDFGKSEAMYDSCVLIFTETNHPEGLAMALQNKALIRKNMGDIPTAIDWYNQSLRIRDSIQDKRGLGYAYYELGVLSIQQDDLESAKGYLEKSLEVRREINDLKGIGLTLNELGMTYKTSDPDKNFELLKQSLSYQLRSKDLSGLGFTYSNLAGAFKQRGMSDSALYYYQEGLRSRIETGDQNGIALSYYLLGANYDFTGNSDSAMYYAQKSFELSDSKGFMLAKSRSSELLHELFRDRKQFEKAYYYLSVFKSVSDSLLNEDTRKQAVKQQMKFEFDKKQAINEEKHARVMALAEEKEVKQRIIIGAIALGLMLVIVFSLIIYRRLKITREQKLIIEETNEELNQQNEEILTQRDQIERQKFILEDKNKEITESITYARRIQEAILPSEKIMEKLLPDSFVLYLPKDIVAGDFYWIEDLEDHVLVAVADCTGHGVPGALVSVVCHNALKRSLREYSLTQPNLILDKTREIIITYFQESENEIKDGMDISLLHLNRKTGEISWSGANNPLYILRSGSEEIEIIKPDKQPVGLTYNPTPFTQHKLKVEQGDLIYLFSDGYADQFGGPNNKKMGYKKFRNLLVEGSSQPTEEQRERLRTAFQEWKGSEEQIDDVCLLGWKV